MKTPHLSFGIELEFNLACLVDGATPIPTETRKVKFNQPPPNNPLEFKATQKDKLVIDSAANLLNSKGFAVNLIVPDVRTMKTWQVDLDGSLVAPDWDDPAYYRDYEYTHLEVKTPALEYNENSLEQVKQVCDLLKSTYVVSNNDSSGLYIHTGRFSAPVPFYINSLKRLIIFLYVFDPQIASLHAPHRVQNSFMIGSIRDISNATVQFQEKRRFRPLPAHLIHEFLDAPDLTTLLTLATNRDNDRYSNYNFVALIPPPDPRMRDVEGRGHTIEFRQHAGTLDGEAITMWVRVLAGIIDFVEDVSPESFAELINAMLMAETWEKEYNEEDGWKEVLYGPVPADGTFTIVDLLEHIGLNEEADYYRTPWRVHTRNDERVTFFR